MRVSRHVFVIKKYFLTRVKWITLDALVFTKPVKQSLDGLRTFIQDSLIKASVAFGNSRDRASHFEVKLLRLELDNIVGLSEHERWEGQVAEGVLELGDVVKALRVLINLVADNTSDHGCSRCNSWDDLTGNHLCLVAISLGDLIVAGTQVWASCNEINVEVAVIILLKVSRFELLST